jgi:hypothetical protein
VICADQSLAELHFAMDLLLVRHRPALHTLAQSVTNLGLF